MQFSFFFLLLLLCIILLPSASIVCRKERISPLGFNDFRGGINVECGQYVNHCLKVQMWDGTIIRDCDPLALCPKNGNKLISRAEYFCCLGNLCNGGSSHLLNWNNAGNIAIFFVPFIATIFIRFLH